MERIAMSKQQAIEAVHPLGVQVFANYALVGPIAAAIEQPISASRPQMNSRPGAEIQHRDFRNVVLRPMRAFDIKMATGNLREQVYDPENDLCQKPVGIVENDSRPQQHEWRQKEREQRDCQNEEGNRNNYQVRQQGNRRDDMKVPEHEWQRTEPGCERNGAATA